MASDAPPPSTPSAWYPDPWRQAVRRHWDGRQWTGHVDSAAPRSRLRRGGRAPTAGRSPPSCSEFSGDRVKSLTISGDTAIARIEEGTSRETWRFVRVGGRWRVDEIRR